jgi:hypothetical protein
MREHYWGTQQRRLSGILTRFPFHPRQKPQAPNLAAKIAQVEDNAKKKSFFLALLRRSPSSATAKVAQNSD